MQELNDLPLNPISNLPQPNIESPKLQLALETLNTDPRFSSQTNEIFSFRSELHNNFNRLVEIRPIVPEFAIVPTIPVIEEEKQTLEDEKDEDLEEVSHLLLKMVKSNLVFQIFFLFFFANCLWNVDFKFLLGLSWLNDSLNCIICIERLWQTKNQKTGCFLNSKLKLKLFDNLILINYKVFILLFLLYRDFNLCYGILALISQCLAQLFFILYLRFYKKKSILSEFLEFGFRLFVLSQISMVSMNLQGLIHWKWKDIFWCFWVIFSVMSGASLGFGLIFLGKLYQKCFEKVENFESIFFTIFFNFLTIL